jgi:hypothetical protein
MWVDLLLSLPPPARREKKEMPKFQPGDHVKIWRIGYKHHGIVSATDANGRITHVIHYVKDEGNPMKGIIKETSLAEFSEVSIARYW